MKNFIVIIAMAFAALSTGCDRGGKCADYHHLEIDYDFRDDVCIVITDADGNNFLDPEFEDNILSRDITVEFKGETYSVVSEDDALTTYPDLALWVGPYSFVPDPPIALIFGGFYPGGDETEELIVNWGDGTSDKINFDYLVTWSWNKGECETRHEAVEESKIWLNDVLVSENSLVVEIVK